MILEAEKALKFTWIVLMQHVIGVFHLWIKQVKRKRWLLEWNYLCLIKCLTLVKLFVFDKIWGGILVNIPEVGVSSCFTLYSMLCFSCYNITLLIYLTQEISPWSFLTVGLVVIIRVVQTSHMMVQWKAGLTLLIALYRWLRTESPYVGDPLIC